MRAFHDTRNSEYRTPYGVLEAGTPVDLTLDVWEAPDAHVQLRTWVDGVGERLYDMQPTYEDDPDDEWRERYRVRFVPEAPGIVWYSFLIIEAWGNVVRYGAREGCTGGVGQLLGWEPPSFQLTVLEVGADEGGEIPATPDTLRAMWADAYEKVRHQALPETLVDPSAERPMFYPFMEAVSAYLLGKLPATELAELSEMLRENYAPAAYEYAFDLLGDPDALRLFLTLSGSNPKTIDELDGSQAGLAKARLWCASLLQQLAPVVPERFTGNTYERAHDLWSDIDVDCEAILCNAADLRTSLPLFGQESPRCFAVNDDIVSYRWFAEDGQALYLYVNASLSTAYDIPVPLTNEMASELISGYGVPIISADEARERLASIPGATEAILLPKTERYALVHLYQLGTAILYVHPNERLQQPMEPGVGVLAHVTSLPSAGEESARAAKSPQATAPLGTLGPAAFVFVDWLAKAGMRYWQVLPVNPTDGHGSPYAGISAFAGNTRLLAGDPAELLQDEAAFAAQEYRAFCEREQHWLDPYASFMAIRDVQGPDLLWQEWPKKYRHYSPELIRRTPTLAEAFEKHRRLQYLFERQWQELRQYANARGVKIIGDMPIYVSADSADVWANPSYFQLGADGMPKLVAGCPPDGFAPEGQVWGNPVYDWEAVRASGFEWWIRRLERAFALYDYVRLDHFIGFERYFSIPVDEKAAEGAYHPGPGRALFEQAQREFGLLPVIAEDLGSITPAVRALCTACGFPGMDIVQFVDGNDPISGYAPRPEKIAYSGTHDNQTLVGYVKTRYPEHDANEAALQLLEEIAACTADVVVFPLQDLMLLDDDARMNIPGTAEGNWTWQATQADIDAALPLAQRLAKRS